MNDNVKPLFANQPHAAQEFLFDTAPAVSSLRELADQIESGKVTLKPGTGVACVWEDHDTYVRTRMAGDDTKFHTMTVLTIAQGLALKDIIGG